MKTAILISIMMVMLPIGTYAQYDDMYFVPKKEKKAETKETQSASSRQEVRQTSMVTSTPVLRESDNGFTLDSETDYSTSLSDERDVDEYNRRYMFYDGGSEEADTLYEDSVAAEEEGEWVNGFNGSDADYQYTKRILRFYTPTVGIPVSSPLYWDLCYGPDAIYWNVYDDGFYAYAFPSSWNSLYYSPAFSWSWGWRPWGWGYSWYGGWYSPWYDPWYYGPWYGYGWYHHPHYWGPHYGGGWAGRPVNRPSVRYREGYSGGRISSVRPSRTTTGTRVTPTRSTGTRVTPSGTGGRINGTRGTSGRGTGTVVRPSGTTTRVAPSRGTVSSVRNNTPVRTTTTNTQTTRPTQRQFSAPSTVRSTPSFSPSRSSIGGGGRVSSPVRSAPVRSGRR